MVGIIQPMCSAPGAFPPGAFFRQKSAPFLKKYIFVCFCTFGLPWDNTGPWNTVPDPQNGRQFLKKQLSQRDPN